MKSLSDMTENDVLYYNWYRLGVKKKKKSNHAHKTGPWYILGVLFKISEEQPRLGGVGGYF